jgi:hypothetical protein
MQDSDFGNDSLHSLELDSIGSTKQEENNDTLNASSKSTTGSYGSSGMLGQSSMHSLEEQSELEFLKRAPTQRRWKNNKRFWKTPIRYGGGRSSLSSPFKSPDEEEATKRRSLIHDSLLKGLDDDVTEKLNI